MLQKETHNANNKNNSKTVAAAAVAAAAKQLLVWKNQCGNHWVRLCDHVFISCVYVCVCSFWLRHFFVALWSIEMKFEMYEKCDLMKWRRINMTNWLIILWPFKFKSSGILICLILPHFKLNEFTVNKGCFLRFIFSNENYVVELKYIFIPYGIYRFFPASFTIIMVYSTNDNVHVMGNKLISMIVED